MPSDDAPPDLTPPGHDRFVPVGHGCAVVFYPDGAVRFRHTCDRAHRDAGVVICAPALQIGNGHEIVSAEPLTIRASILCPDCSTHGFVTAGRWEPC